MPNRDVDVATLLRRIEAIEAQLSRGQRTLASPARDLLVKIASTPPSAGCYYECDLYSAGGDEVEGHAGVLAGPGNSILALNLGGRIPPLTTPVLVTLAEGGRWVFRYG